MVSEQVDRMRLGWSREDLARYSGVSVASVYLIERFGSSTEGDDARMREALTRGLAARGVESSRRESGSGLATENTDEQSSLSRHTDQAGRRCDC